MRLNSSLKGGIALDICIGLEVDPIPFIFATKFNTANNGIRITQKKEQI